MPKDMTMSIELVVTDEAAEGLALDAALEVNGSVDLLELAPGDDVASLANRLEDIVAIRVTFPSFADGRGFTQAKQLRRMGYTGRLVASGHVINDQFRMAQAVGFDQVELSSERAERQNAGGWAVDLATGNYLDRLR